MGECPHCEKVLTYVNFGEIRIGAPLTDGWRGISYVCPYCGSLLGIGVDPVALKSDTVSEIGGAFD